MNWDPTNTSESVTHSRGRRGRVENEGSQGGTHDGAGRLLVGRFSGKYSSSELRRDPGVDWAEKRLLGVCEALVLTCPEGGEVT